MLAAYTANFQYSHMCSVATGMNKTITKFANKHQYMSDSENYAITIVETVIFTIIYHDT